MYTVAVRRSFIAQHFLFGGDWGRENQLNSHHYTAEVRLAGPTLDQHGYLVDIVEIETALDGLVERYRDRSLNDQPEFAGLNPSVEHFARILAESLAKQLTTGHLARLTVKLWEHDQAWAAFQLNLNEA